MVPESSQNYMFYSFTKEMWDDIITHSFKKDFAVYYDNENNV